MSFTFKEVTISGGNRSVEGTSGVINQVVDAMTTAGWSIVDDRRSQSGSSLLTNTHKIVMVNDGGETGTNPNLYITLTSGTAAATNSNVMGMQIHTAYDVGSHAVPASGLKNPNTTTLSQMRTLATDSNGYNNLWVAADQDTVVIVNDQIGTTTSWAYLGRVERYLDSTFEPYGAMIFTTSTPTPVGNNAVGFVGENPVENITTSSDGDLLNYSTLSATNEPRSGLGNEEAIFTALPTLWAIDDASPVRKGVIGHLRHVFSAANSNAGLPPFGKMTVSGTGQEFRVFGKSAVSLVVRAS